MPDYKNGKIYAIRSHQTDKIYIGSTTVTLSRSMSSHRSKYKQYRNNKYSFTTSFHILEFDDAYIELLEICSCNSKEELLKKEGELIRNIECVNKCIPGRTIKEWRKDNKEQIAIKGKEYYDGNTEKIKNRHEQYYKNNKQKIMKKRIEWGVEKCKCECGLEIQKQSLTRHKKTDSHLERMVELKWENYKSHSKNED